MIAGAATQASSQQCTMPSLLVKFTPKDITACSCSYNVGDRSWLRVGLQGSSVTPCYTDDLQPCSHCTA